MIFEVLLVVGLVCFGAYSAVSSALRALRCVAALWQAQLSLVLRQWRCSRRVDVTTENRRMGQAFARSFHLGRPSSLTHHQDQKAFYTPLTRAPPDHVRYSGTCSAAVATART